MGLLDGWRRWRKAGKARALLAQGHVDAARVLLGADLALRQALAEELLEAGQLDTSRALLGHEGSSTLGALLAATAADPELDRLRAEARAPALPDDERVLALAAQLGERGHGAEALALVERAALERHTWPLLRDALERCCEAEAWARAWPLVEAGFGWLGHASARGTPEHAYLLRTHARVLGRLRGTEAVTVDLLMRGELDPFSGEHPLVLARALMRTGPLSSRLELVPASQELREGEARLSSDRTDATGLMQVGSAHLRLGELDEALQAFERGRAVAPRHFGLVAGLGAALRLRERGDLERLASLPALTEPVGLAEVLPDYAVMTVLEQRVALASVAPLARWLPAVAAAGTPLRVVPLDVRVEDLPDFAARAARVAPRPWDALGGLAGDGLGCARVETLLDLGERGWALAHELAHLVYGVLPSPLVAELLHGLARAKAAAFSFESGELGDEREFFAHAYTRWLARRYGLPLGERPDAQGNLGRALACIDAVTATVPEG